MKNEFSRISTQNKLNTLVLVSDLVWYQIWNHVSERVWDHVDNRLWNQLEVWLEVWKQVQKK